MHKNIKRYFPIFVLPTLIAFVIAFLVPFVVGVVLSFCKFTTIIDAKWVGFDNYIKAFTVDQGTFLNALWFTVKFSIVSIFSVNIIAFILASLLTKGIRGTNFFRTVFFVPNLIGGIVLGYIWQLIISGVLQHLETTIDADSKYGFWGLIFAVSWQSIGYMMVIYIAGLQNVPSVLLEAAQIDGASKRQTLFKVTIPMVMPSITICTFLTLTNSFKLFDQNLAITNGTPNGETRMLALDIYNTFYGRTGFEGVGQAKAVVFFIIVAIIAFAQLYFTRRKEVEQ